MMRGCAVYRVDNAKGRKEAIGSLLERRASGRGTNLLKLLVEAKRIFGDHDPVSSSEATTIVLAPPSNTRRPDGDRRHGDHRLEAFGAG